MSTAPHRLRRKCWVRNVVAIGLSSGFIEPLESTSIHLIQTGINRLIELLPAGEISDATRGDYNARSAWEIVRSAVPLIHRASPVDVAMRPSMVWAYLRTT